MSTGPELRLYPGESVSRLAAVFFCFRRRQKKNARPAKARRARGAATAGAIIEAFELDSGGLDGVEEVGLDTGAATTLDREVVRVLDTPSDLVTTEVTTTMLVMDSGLLLLLLFASIEAMLVGVVVVVPGVFGDGDVVVVVGPCSVVTTAADPAAESIGGPESESEVPPFMSKASSGVMVGRELGMAASGDSLVVGLADSLEAGPVD